jgi:glycosyltransferase involved in cell wall biosynthesis
MPEVRNQYNTLVSVIIPCYNGEKYLSEALDSIIIQSHANWECTVVDDGSTDGSKEIVQSYMQKDPRFKYVHQNNAGPSAARNLGMKISNGIFFQFLDSDDLIEKDKLKRQVEVFYENPSCDIVYGDMKYFSRSLDGQMELKADDDTYWKKGKISGRGDEVIKVLLNGNIMVVNSPLIRRTIFEKIGGWDEQIWFNEDWDVWTRCALQELAFQFDDTRDTKALVRAHTDSRSRDVFKMYLYGFKVYLKIDDAVKLKNYKKIIKPKIYSIQRTMEKILLAKYKEDKPLSLDNASMLYKETNLFHYRIFTWLIHNMPCFFSQLYSGGTFLFNRLKCKIIYES